MSLLHIVSYGAVVIALLFVTLSLASGLLWIAEVIEEHSRTAKIVGQRVVYAVITFHILLYTFDSNDLPLTHIAFSLGCHFVYLLNFSSFPLIKLTSWPFITSCLLVIANHFLWFLHFHNVLESARKRERRWQHPMEPIAHVPTFLDISTFFGICVWLVPLFLFLSLSANDNALPTASRHDPNTALMSAFDPSRPIRIKPQRSSLFISLSTSAFSFFSSRKLSREKPDEDLVAQQISQPLDLLHQDFAPRFPGLQGRDALPGSSPAVSVSSPRALSPVAPSTSSDKISKTFKEQ